jgi:hypothetical protein
VGWVVDERLEANVRRKFKRPASCKSKFFVCMYVCGHCHSTCSLWLALVAMLRKFDTWFAEVNAPTQTLVDVEAQGSGVNEDEEVLSGEDEDEAREQKKIDDDADVREMTLQGTVTLV